MRKVRLKAGLNLEGTLLLRWNIKVMEDYQKFVREYDMKMDGFIQMQAGLRR